MNNNPQENTVLGVKANIGGLLCYLPICGISLIYSIMVLVTEAQSKFMRFNAIQSLLLTAAYLLFATTALFLMAFVGAFTGSAELATLFFLIFLVVLVSFIGAMIFLMIKACQYIAYRLPIIGGFADKWSN